MIVHPGPKISRDADCETRDNLNHYYVHTVHCTLARILHFGTSCINAARTTVLGVQDR